MATLGCALTLVVWGSGRAAATDVPVPVFHGVLGFTPANGRIDRNRSRGYLASLKVRKWALVPDGSSNGISPGTEVIAIIVDSKTWAIDPGTMIESKHGGTWTYAVKGRSIADGIKSLRIRHEADGSFSFRFVLTGIDGTSLENANPVCFPFAVSIGDDDAFTGINLNSPGFFNSSKLRVREMCPPTGHGGHQH